MLKILLYLLLCIISILPVQAAQPTVFVTIKPIHSLVTHIMGNVGTPYLLLQGGESPHNYSLQPSQVKQLYQSDLIIWIGPGIETFLERTLIALSDKTPILRLIDTPQLILLPIPKNKLLTEHSHEKSHFGSDSHIWLSPDNAKLIAKLIADTLSQIDEAHHHEYQNNAIKLITKLDQLDKKIQQQLKFLKEKPYLVFHDAYRYFQHHYGLTMLEAINLSPEIRPSLKRIYQLRHILKEQQIYCIFTEPQFKPNLIDVIIEGLAIHRGILDPLGAELPIGKESYFSLLNNLANSFQTCLENR